MTTTAMGGMRMKKPAASVDDYLKPLPRGVRAALQKLRRTIKSAAPDAAEVISYRIPAYKHHGMLVGFAAFKDHCSFFVKSPKLMNAHKTELARYKTAKGTIHFAPTKPLPAALVKKLVKARIAENEAKNKS